MRETLVKKFILTKVIFYQRFKIVNLITMDYFHKGIKTFKSIELIYRTY